MVGVEDLLFVHAGLELLEESLDDGGEFPEVLLLLELDFVPLFGEEGLGVLEFLEFVVAIGVEVGEELEVGEGEGVERLLEEAPDGCGVGGVVVPDGVVVELVVVEFAVDHGLEVDFDGVEACDDVGGAVLELVVDHLQQLLGGVVLELGFEGLHVVDFVLEELEEGLGGDALVLRVVLEEAVGAAWRVSEQAGT